MWPMENLTYYIGVDHREPEALRVAEASAKAYASRPLTIRHLEHLDLRRRNFFNRPWRTTGDGLTIDERDGKPFSVQFSHSRFLTPIVAKAEERAGWALFSDCDWLWLDDPFKILKEADLTKTVMVVPHDFTPNGAVKMDGQQQVGYPRKLWSALMLWNLASDKIPSLDYVNNASGRELHSFAWLKDSDIGFLSEAWHWIPNYSPTTAQALDDEDRGKPCPINGIHFTYGPPVPGMFDRELTPFDQFWTNEYKDAYNAR